MSLTYNVVNIRKLLVTAFNDEALSIFCYDHFRPVYDSFGAGMGKTQKIQLLIEHCQNYLLLDNLLALVAQINPAQYSRWATTLALEASSLIPSPPTPSRHFTGRLDLLAELSTALTQSDGAFIALWGMGGIGKTTIARKLAEELRPNFPGGILWADLPEVDGNVISILQGWALVWGANLTSESNPSHLSQIVRGLLRIHQLQVGPLLMIIDDLREPWLKEANLLCEALPAHASLLITTREVDLAQALECDPYPIHSLTPDEALDLLRKYARSALVGSEIEMVNELLANLGYLPLALKLAGKWLTKFSRRYGRRSVAKLKESLTRQGLNSLALPEQPELTTTFALSYKALDEKTQRVFRGLGIFAAGSFRLPSVAGVLDIPLEETDRAFNELVDLALIEWGEPGADETPICLIHPLLKQYAQLLLTQTNEIEQIQQAYLTYYLALAEANAQNTPEVHSRLDVELANLLYAAKLAAELDQYQAVSDFGLALWEKGEFLLTRGYYRDALELLTNAAKASRSLGDKATEAIHLKNIGKTYDSIGELEKAETFYLQSLNYYHLAPKEVNELQYCNLRYHLAALYIIQQRYQDATDLIGQNLSSASLEEDLAWKKIQAQSHHTLSNIAIGQNELLEAQKQAEYSLQVYQDLNDDQGQAEAFYNLGVILTRQGNNPVRANESYQQSFSYWQKTSNIRSQAHTLWQMSILERNLQQYSLAFEHLKQAEAIGQRIGELSIQIGCKTSRGLIYLAEQKRELACEEWQIALSLLNDKLPHFKETIISLIDQHCSNARANQSLLTTPGDDN